MTHIDTVITLIKNYQKDCLKISSYYIKDMGKRLHRKTTITKSLTSTEADFKFALDSGESTTDKVKFGNQK